jgi:Flp pilus assembly protein TadD
MTQTPQASTLQQLAATLTQAYQFWNAGNADQAELLCRQVLAVWPGQADALHLLGLMAHAYGNADLALDYLREACRAPRAPGLFFRNLAEMCRRRGLLAEGEQAGRRAVRLDAGDADSWNNLGIILQECGQIDESIDCLQRALALRANDPQILNNLGNSQRLAGCVTDAEQSYRRALEQAPESAQTHNNLAALAVLCGKLDAGEQFARAALECEPHFAEAYLNLADIEHARANQGEALRWLDALLAFAPEHVGALSARARLLLQSGLAESASESARRAVALGPQDGTAHQRLGDALRALDQTEAALSAYRRAAALPGLQREEALLSQAGLLRACGRAAEARAVCAEAHALFPASLRVQQALNDMAEDAAG